LFSYGGYPGQAFRLYFAIGVVWPLSDHGSLRGRRVPPHDGVRSVGLVTSRTRSI
jgi:hypothetical protein